MQLISEHKGKNLYIETVYSPVFVGYEGESMGILSMFLKKNNKIIRCAFKEYKDRCVFYFYHVMPDHNHGVNLDNSVLWIILRCL